MPGPQYQSGNYQESYSAAFNRGTVHFRPDLQYIDPETGEVTPYSEPLSFGKQAAQERGQPGLKQARPTSLWDLHLPASDRNLRPAFKHTGDDQEAETYTRRHRNLRHRMNAPYYRVRHVNVHTSPGKSTPTINQQVNDIRDQLESLREEEPNTMASGDFYMQRGSRRNWTDLNSGTGDFQAVHPGVPTNFKKGRGIQTADHFVTPSDWEDTDARALPPQGSEDLADWEEHGIDHAFVSGHANVPIQETVSALALYLERIFRDLIYRQNNCLIHAIANAAGVAVNGHTIRTIRQRLRDQEGVALGDFIEADDENVEIIMRGLGLYGTVHVFNVENPEAPAAPVAVLAYHGGRNVDIDINYSQFHFYSAPRNG